MAELRLFLRKMDKQSKIKIQRFYGAVYDVKEEEIENEKEKEEEGEGKEEEVKGVEG